MNCPHERFDAGVTVNRLDDSQQYNADVWIRCQQCGVSMVFLGLPRGVDLKGAATNIDGTEARLAIHPLGETAPDLPGGFQIRKGD